jgi:DDE superfamily endonuclease
MDNYGTHGTPEVKAWLRKHPRFVIHYVPTSCGWLNLIERWFAELTNKRIHRDSFFSVDELVAAINDFLAAWNENPRPFVWTAFRKINGGRRSRCSARECASAGGFRAQPISSGVLRRSNQQCDRNRIRVSPVTFSPA